ncbi:hypothetical protein ACXNSR_01370 [Streptomyces sp. NC-S4]
MHAVLGRAESAWALLPGLREELEAVVADLPAEERAELRLYGPTGRRS